MDGATPEPSAAHELVIGRIDDVLAALGAQGLVIDAEQRVRLYGLLAQLAANGQLPADVTRLSRLVTPVLSATPAQQAICEATFKSVMAGSWAPGPPDGISDKRSEADPERKTNLRYRQPRTTMVVALAALLAAIAFAAVIYLPLLTRPPTSMEHSPGVQATKQSIGHALDWLENYLLKSWRHPGSRHGTALGGGTIRTTHQRNGPDSSCRS